MTIETRIETPELTFHGIAHGSGKPALLLHGFPDTPYSFARQIEYLSDHGFRAFAPALRGYPPTGGAGPYSIEVLAEDVIVILEAMNASEKQPALLVGHDWGGIIACAVAARRPELLSHAVIISVPHPAVMAARFLGGDFEQLKRSWYMFLFQIPQIAETIVSANNFAFIERLMLDWSPDLTTREGTDEIQRRKAALSAEGTLSAALGYYRAMFDQSQSMVGPVTVPTMVVFGAHDGCISPEGCENMDSFFHGGYRFEIIEGVGHFVPTEAPEELNALLGDFIAEKNQ